MIVAITCALAKWFKGKELAFAFGVNLTIARLGSFAALNSPTLAKPLFENVSVTFPADGDRVAVVDRVSFTLDEGESSDEIFDVAGRKVAPVNAIAEALFLSGSALGELGDHDGAIASYRRLVALSQGYGDRGRLGLARSLQATGNDEEALNEAAPRATRRPRRPTGRERSP